MPAVSTENSGSTWLEKSLVTEPLSVIAALVWLLLNMKKATIAKIIAKKSPENKKYLFIRSHLSLWLMMNFLSPPSIRPTYLYFHPKK